MDQADLLDAENRGDMAKVHKVLSAQSERLKKIDKQSNKTDPQKPESETSAKETSEAVILDAFDELRWT
jgi:hypothetical protein